MLYEVPVLCSAIQDVVDDAVFCFGLILKA